MSQTPDPRSSLRRLDAEQRLLGEQLLRLAPADLDQPSNLPGWRIVDLAVHVTRVCDSILLAVQRATVGDRTPAFGAAAKPREEAIRAMDPAGWVRLQRDAYRDLTRQVGDLSDAQLEQFGFPHPLGERSARWFCTQLLAEVAFHRWDLAESLARLAPLAEDPAMHRATADAPVADAADASSPAALAGHGPLEADLAAYLLPFLLDAGDPLFAQRRAASGPQAFALASDGTVWVLTASEQGTTVEHRSAGPEPIIEASPGWLALAIYGRVRSDAPAFHTTGASDTADRFAAIFGPTS